MKKSVFFIAVIVLLLGALGFGGYKYMELQKDNDKLTDDNKSITEELNKQKEAAEEAKKEQEKASATNDYSLFVKKMKEERKKLFNSKTLNIDFGEPERTYADNKDYYIDLTENGTLILEINSKKTEVAKNVLLYRIVYLGNGAFKALFYVTEDGSVYDANVEEVIYSQAKLKSKKQKNAKEIVSIIPGSSSDVVRDSNGKIIQGGGGAAHPFFVDINGNIYPYEYTD